MRRNSDTDNADEKAVKSIDKQIEEVKNDVDEMSKDILGYGNTIKELIDPTITTVNFDRYGMNKFKSVQANIFNIRGKDKTSKYQLSDRIFSFIDGNEINATDLSTMLQGRASMNSEMNYLVNEMVELQTALDQLADDIVFPNVSTKSGIKIEFSGNNEEKDSEKEENLIKYFRPLDNPLSTIHNRKVYNYNIEEDVKNIVQYFGIYGHQIVVTIPYKKIAQDLLYDRTKYDRENGTMVANSEISSVSEAADILRGKFNAKSKTTYGESLYADKLEQALPNVFNKDITDQIRSIVSNVPYSEADVEYLSYMIENNPSEYFTDTKVKTKIPSGSITDLLTPTGEDSLNQLELSNVEILKEKQSRKFNIDNLVGCTHDILDPSKTVPVYLKNEIIGVYVVENDTINSAELGNSLANIINASTLKDNLTTQLNQTYSDKVKEMLFTDIRKVLMANLDKRMLKNNPTLVEDIQYILEQEVDTRTTALATPKVKFIPKEYLTIHKIGNGPLGIPLLLKARIYAHCYIQLMKSDLMSKIFLEKPRWKITLPFNGDSSNNSRIQQAIANVRHAVPTLLDIGIPDVMNSSSATYNTIYVPKSNDDTQPFDIEQLPGMQTQDNTELLRLLRNQATMAIGYPADVLDPSQNLDFAKKIANINARHLIRIRSIQNILSLSMSELCSKRLRYMTGNDKLEVTITFEAPNELTDTVTRDKLDMLDKLSDAYGAFIDKDPRVPKEFKEQVKQGINERLTDGVLDFDMLTEVIEEAMTYQIGNRDID